MYTLGHLTKVCIYICHLTKGYATKQEYENKSALGHLTKEETLR